jgi:hypothetical protein
MTKSSIAPPRLILEAGRADRRYWRDVWRCRELFVILAWRDVTVRYKRTFIPRAMSSANNLPDMVGCPATEPSAADSVQPLGQYSLHKRLTTRLGIRGYT